MALPDLMDLVMHDPRRLVALRAVAGEEGGALPHVEQLWRKPSFALGQGGQPAKSGLVSLEDLIDRNRGLALVDGGGGPQPIDVPFTSLVVLTAEALPGAQEFGRFLADRITQRFRDVIDPDLGVAVHVEQSLHASAPVSVYLGHGIHAPASDERLAHGEVTIRDASGEAVGQPTIGNSTPGGLFPGQARLAFSRSETLTPCIHPDLPAGAIFMLGRFPIDTVGRDGGGLLALSALPQTPEARAQSLQVEPMPEQSGIDARFEISGIRAQAGRVPLALVDVVLDRRASRLHHQPPAGPHLAIVGLAIPEHFGSRRVARYWVDRSQQGRIRASAMVQARDSIVVQGRDARRYDRRELRYVRLSPSEMRAGSVGFDNRRRSVLMLEEGEFGYLALPPTPTAIGFGPDRAALGHGGFDWIGEAVRVQFGSGEVERLDALYDQVPAGLIAAAPGGVAVQSAGDIWLLGKPGAQNAGTSTIPAGAPFVLGPLVVEMRGGGR